MVVDVFNTPLYYISFNKKPRLEKELRKLGFNNINHFEAIDGRKFDLKKLLEKNIITIRTYNDLIYGREQHTGMPTPGGIGCTLSHRSLWKLCIDQKLPYITIVEDDVKFKNPITDKDIENINNSLKKPNGMFVSSHNYNKGSEYFFGLQFYMLTNGCAKEIYKYSLPIDVQTDAYINNINNRGLINIEGYNLCSQSVHKSSIQDFCLKCRLPKNPLFYILIILFIIMLIILYIYNKKQLTNTRSELNSCRSSCMI